MNNYTQLEVIGRGSFGVIRKIRRNSDSKVLVSKEIDYRGMSLSQKKQLVTEVNLLRELRHPNIVRYYERIVDKESCTIYIIMEYCESGDLGSIVQRCKREGRVISEDIVWNVFSQILSALVACHTGQLTPGIILHRDIKPDNIFLDADQIVKLGDFGLSRILTEDLARTFVGTPYYMSPELVNEAEYDDKSDIWSLGCVVYEMCALRPPFEANNQGALYSKISQGRVSRLPMRYSEELNRLVLSMLQQDRTRRPSAKELMAHDRVQASLKRVELSQYEKYLGKKEAELREREESLRKREALVKEKEELLREKERLFDDKEDRPFTLPLPNEVLEQTLSPFKKLSIARSKSTYFNYQ